MAINFDTHKSIIETLFLDMCNIYEYDRVFDETTKQSINSEVLKYENLPCKLSQAVNISSSGSLSKGEGNYEVLKVVKLFIPTGVIVKAGAKIIITANGITDTYLNASEPAFFSTHTELTLTLEKERA